MYAVIFLTGLIFGSLANVIIYRLNTGESLIFGGSRCFSCGRNLRWLELIPVLSFLFLRGRCRTCGARISWQYPFVELASALLFLLLWSTGSNGAWSSWSAVFFWLLLVISVYDLRHKIIPNSLVYSAIAIAAIFLILDIGIWDLSQPLLSGLGLFSFFAILWLVSRGKWMGFGDAKLALAIGLILGWPESLAATFFSFWLGAAVGLGWLAYQWVRGSNGSNGSKGTKGIKGIQIPFAPFLSAGGLTAFLWGEKIISWYLGLL